MSREGTVKNAAGVKIDQISKVFITGKESFVAVNQVSIEINRGELVTLLGPSGCGKTTILRMLSGFCTPTSGNIYFGDKDVTHVLPNKRGIGMMFQSYALFPHMTVEENVAYGMRVQGFAKEEIKQRVEKTLEMMKLTRMRDRIPEMLSGGQQQRVALARAIITEPEILLFDEPLSNLDAKMREYMRDELRSLQQKLGITSIYVTHDQAEAMAISDRIVIMNNGIIEQVGTPYEIYSKPRNKFVAYFMGKANFVNAAIHSVRGKEIEISLLGKVITVPQNEATPFVRGDSGICLIRPEQIRIDKNGDYEARIANTCYFGDHMEYQLIVLEQTLEYHDYSLKEHGIYNKGDIISVDFERETLRLLPSEK